MGDTRAAGARQVGVEQREAVVGDRHPVAFAPQADASRAVAGEVEDLELADPIPLGERVGDLHRASVPGAHQPGGEQAGRKRELSEVEVVGAAILLGVGALVGVAVDRGADRVGTTRWSAWALPRTTLVAPPVSAAARRSAGLIERIPASKIATPSPSRTRYEFTLRGNPPVILQTPSATCFISLTLTACARRG